MNAARATVARQIALVGNPNCGKTAMFNQLTGSRQKVANYAGVTVERKEGRFTTASGQQVRVLDLPGAYSFDATSPDEQITRDVCKGHHPEEPKPDLLVCVADATNLRLHLRFVLEVRQLGQPMLLALNMMDAAARRGIRVDIARLQAELGIPVIATIAVKRNGVDALRSAIDTAPPAAPTVIPALDLHAETRRLMRAAVQLPVQSTAVEDALDRVVLHPVFGLALLATIMFLIFQAVYAWAAPLMEAIDAGTAALAAWVNATLPEGPLASLLADGIIAGLGGVVIFLPQILILFAFILLLEESGYLPRAAFLLDRMMS
ncbi:MAG: ferrous iron transporter B, partial [Xanthomonadales bacterium]|nr:ferrous iron transporter B [Xanthomonadales bacterium]